MKFSSNIPIRVRFHNATPFFFGYTSYYSTAGEDYKSAAVVLGHIFSTGPKIGENPLRLVIFRLNWSRNTVIYPCISLSHERTE